MPAHRSAAAPVSSAIALVAAVMVVSVAMAADSPGVISVRPGQWDFTSQLWLDGKAVLRGVETDADRARRQATEKARAQMSAEQLAMLDRLMPSSATVLRDSKCLTPAEARIDLRAKIREAIESMHATPWSCALRSEQPSGRSYFLEYACTTAAGGRAEGNGRAMVNGDGGYTVAIEGKSHAVDAATGKPLESRLLDARMVNDGGWTSAQCTREASSAR